MANIKMKRNSISTKNKNEIKGRNDMEAWINIFLE